MMIAKHMVVSMINFLNCIHHSNRVGILPEDRDRVQCPRMMDSVPKIADYINIPSS
jgi:hypothetical protein